MPQHYDPNAYSPERQRRYMFWSQKIFTPMYTIKNGMEITGRENIPPEGKFVVVSNHLSNWDPPLVTAVVDLPVIYLAKQELFEMPGFREFCKFFGAIPINRAKPEKSTFKAVKDVFAKGWHLGMFIEGTRNKTPGTLGLPHTGAAYFAKANKATIIPVGIIGSNKAFGKIHAHIGKPMQPSDDLEKTTWEIMQVLSDLTGFALPARHESIQEV